MPERVMGVVWMKTVVYRLLVHAVSAMVCIATVIGAVLAHSG